MGEEDKAARDSAVKVVIVGGGIAGVSAAESLRQAAPGAEIILVSKEEELPYYRLNLTRHLAGEIGDEALPLRPEAWYEENNIQLLRGKEVSALALDDLAVDLRDGDRLAFERLIMTVGAHPFTPPIPGTAREGVTALRTLSDAKAIREMAVPGAKCVCIGGGLLGLETAGALARHGVDVTVLERLGWFLPLQLTEKAGRMLADRVADIGIALRPNAQVAEILGDDRVRGVQLEGGDVLPTDLIVICTGIRPNSYLARLAGLKVNEGIVVNNRLETSHPNVLAAGDVAEHHGTVYGTWRPSQYQGRIAGMNAVEVGSEFDGMPLSTTLKVLGVKLFSIGIFQPQDGSYTTFDHEADGNYLRFVFQGTHLVGSILLGDAGLMATIRKAIEGKADFSDLLGKRPCPADVIAYLKERKT